MYILKKNKFRIIHIEFYYKIYQLKHFLLTQQVYPSNNCSNHAEFSLAKSCPTPDF